MNYYNLDKLIRISIREPEEIRRYGYRKQIKIFGVEVQKEGVYSLFFTKSYICSVDEFVIYDSAYTFKNGKIYSRHSIRLTFQSNVENMYYFDTLEECEKQAEEIKKRCGNWIK